MDYKVFLYFHNMTIKHKNISNIIKISTKISTMAFRILYIIICILLLYKSNNYIYTYLIVPLFTLIVSLSIKKFIKRPRPFVKEKVEPVICHKESGSFPSNHATSSMIIALTTGYIYNFLYIPLVLFSIITGLLRIMSGVHYLSDVLAGFTISLLLFIVIVLV